MRLILVLLMLSSATAFAHGKKAPAPPPPPPSNEELAKKHFQTGEDLYNKMNYRDAILEMETSWKLSPKPLMLFNLGRCYEALGRMAEAVDAYERFLEAFPNADDRMNIEQHIADIRTRLEQQEPPKTPSLTLPPTPKPAPVAIVPVRSPPPPKPRIATWVVGGLGIALLGAGVGTGVGSQLAFNDLTAQCGGKTCDLGMHPNAIGERDRGHALSISTDILLPVGGVAVATAIVLYFVEPRARH